MATWYRPKCARHTVLLAAAPACCLSPHATHAPLWKRCAGLGAAVVGAALRAGTHRTAYTGVEQKLYAVHRRERVSNAATSDLPLPALPEPEPEPESGVHATMSVAPV
jgi:hypothetical protein